MKNKLLATIAAFGLVGSASAIEINDNLSINGFIDGSYQYSDTDLSTTTRGGPNHNSNANRKDQALGADEVELNFITNVGNVDGVINIDSHDDLNGVEVEQAHITYTFDSGVSVTLGKYGSALGFEREDPTSLYTFSRAYGDVDTRTGNGNDSAFNLGDVDNNVVEGVTVGYSNDVVSLGASFENALSTDAEEDDLNMEIAVSYTGIENVTLGLGYYFDNQSDTNNEIDVLNVHASTSLGKLFVAAEYTELNRGGNNSDLDGYLFLADYDLNDKFGAALRVSSNEKTTGSDYEKITIAPNYAITDSLGAIIEYSDIDDAGTDSNLLAVELLYTF